jgi:diguanylate cyclase
MLARIWSAQAICGLAEAVGVGVGVGDGLGASGGVSAGMVESDAVGDSRGAAAPAEPQAELSAATNTRTIPNELRRIDLTTPESELGYEGEPGARRACPPSCPPSCYVTRPQRTSQLAHAPPTSFAPLVATGMASGRKPIAVMGACIAGLTVVFAAWGYWRWGGAALTDDVYLLGLLAANLVAAAACMVAGLCHHGRRRLAWLLIGASALSWTAGEAAWSWYAIVQEAPVPAPGFPDVGYLGAIPFAVAGLSVFVVRREAPADLLRTILDGAIVAGSVFFVSWVLVLGTMYRNSTGSALQNTVALLYPSTDVLIVIMALIVLARAAGADRLPFSLLASGLLANAVADSAFSYLSATNSYSGGSNLSDTGYWTGYLLVALAAICAAIRPSASGTLLYRASRLRDWHPYISLGLVGALAVWQNLRGALGPTEVGILTLIGAGVLARQFLTLLDNQRLTRQLHAVTEELRADITARKRAEELLAHRATHDSLTDLPTRTLFSDRVGQALRFAVRTRTPVSVLMIDLDKFKIVNDRLGHDVGDELLKSCARRLRDTLRASDTIARLGGDEFVVLLPQTAGTGAQRVAGKLLAALDTPFPLAGENLSITLSAGIATFPLDGDTPDALLRAADVAMYEGKRAGGHIAVASHAAGGQAA